MRRLHTTDISGALISPLLNAWGFLLVLYLTQYVHTKELQNTTNPMCLGVIESSMFSFFSSSKNLTSKGLGLIQGIWVLWGESFQCKQMYSGCSPFLAASHTITIQESQRDCKEDPAREKLNSLHMHLKDRRQGPKKFCRGSRREKGSKQDKWTQSNLMQ